MTETHVPTDGERDPTPGEMIARGYADSTEYETKKAHRRAGAHRPEHDAEAERLTSTIGDALPLQTRLALAYHESARTAAEQLDDTKEK